jgi:hypothetical protein
MSGFKHGDGKFIIIIKLLESAEADERELQKVQEGVKTKDSVL